MGGVLPGGLTLRGLSGGESRRLHIACGVVNAPSILFLDEPTSGKASKLRLPSVACFDTLSSTFSLHVDFTDVLDPLQIMDGMQRGVPRQTPGSTGIQLSNVLFWSGLFKKSLG